MSIRRKRTFLALTSSFVFTVGSILLAAHCGFIFNVTDSIPFGLYRMTDSTTGSYVLFCLTGDSARLADSRGYRPRSIGAIACPDGYVPLGKPLAAHPGDIVTVASRGISVNGKLLKNSVAALRDGEGRPMPTIPYGVYAVSPGTIWAVSTYNPRSYDSRYYGPIPREKVIAYERPVWTF